MDNDNVQPRTGKQKRPATLKQRRFAAALTDPDGANGNGTLAARIAGYKGSANALGVTAFENLRNPTVQRLIAETVDPLTERAVQRLGEALDATTSRVFLDRKGRLVYATAVPDHRVRLHAIDRVLDLGAKCASAHEIQAGSDVGGAEQLTPADRALIDKAAEIEAELGELGGELSDDGADHCDGDHRHE